MQNSEDLRRELDITEKVEKIKKIFIDKGIDPNYVYDVMKTPFEGNNTAKDYLNVVRDCKIKQDVERLFEDIIDGMDLGFTDDELLKELASL